jgi:UDPglucose--hexose-1-phosphate uridylyltransferase
MSTRVRRTSTQLADGRELLYFDDTEPYLSGAAVRDAVDSRPLGPRAAAGTMRLDFLTGDWVAIAGHRQTRTFMPPADECPLCPTGVGTVASEVPDRGYDVVVFENRFPSFATVATEPEPSDDPMHTARPAFGRCEVVCFTSDHDASFASLSPSRARTVIEAWVDRTRELSAIEGIAEVFCFENRGREIGVTLSHPHGQIYAYPYVAPRTRGVLARAQTHLEETGRLLGADILAAERRSGERIVLSNEHWTAYVPYAARWPVEAHLVPNRDVPDLPSLDDRERDALATTYLELLRRLDRYYVSASGEPIPLPYIAGWHQAPVREGRQAARLSMQLLSVLRAPGKLKYLAGSESGVGAWVNDVAPEQVAARLREVAS